MKKEGFFSNFGSIADLNDNLPGDLFTRLLEPIEVRTILELGQALWTYDGKPCKEKPHALLASGNHSNGFVMVGDVIKKYPNIRKLFAFNLALSVIRAHNNSMNYFSIGWVTGADTSSTDLAGDVARFFNAHHLRMIKKEVEGGKKIQIWSPENIESIDDLSNSGLQVEELITTSKSAMDVRMGIKDRVGDRHFNFGNFLPTIVNRSSPENPVNKIEGSSVLHLLRLYIENFPPDADKCPLCKAGSEAIKPKISDNWARLTAK